MLSRQAFMFSVVAQIPHQRPVGVELLRVHEGRDQTDVVGGYYESTSGTKHFLALRPYQELLQCIQQCLQCHPLSSYQRWDEPGEVGNDLVVLLVLVQHRETPG